jgi:hypothetical protein
MDYARLRAFSCLAFVILWSSGTAAVMAQEQQNAFRAYSIASGWGYYSVAFAPDDRHLAAITSKGFRGERGVDVTQEIQVWDFRDTKLISEKVLSRDRPSTEARYQEISLYDYVRSGSMILLRRGNHLVLLDSRTLDEIREINLATGSWPLASSPSTVFSFVKEVAVDKNGDRVAVLLQWGRDVGGELRVYNLNSGNLVRSWDYNSLRKNDHNANFGGAAISGDGRLVAVSVIPFVLGEGALRSSDRNVFVLDVDLGSIRSAINTGYPAGHVCFAATEPPVLLSVSADNFDRQRSPKDAIKVWDPLNGKLMRELMSVPGGVHFQVQTSSDGQIVLGYTGLEKFTGHWWLGQEETGVIAYDQFTFWDLASGRVIASSPQITPSESHASFLLSPSGNVVLLYPNAAGGEPLTFYQRR